MLRNSHSLPEPFYQVMQVRVGEPTTHGDPPLPPFPPETCPKCNKSLKDPVRGAGSTQMQTQSYRNRQSGNLARKVRNAFPGSTALTLSWTAHSQSGLHVLSQHHICPRISRPVPSSETKLGHPRQHG